MPSNWAATQANLGVTLTRLGERVSDTAPLEAAVTAYRAALQVFTRERAPRPWAETQVSLGNALLRLGARDVGGTHLEQAATAYRGALDAFPADHPVGTVVEARLREVDTVLAERRVH